MLTKVLRLIISGPRSGERSHCAQATAATDEGSVSVENASVSTSENLFLNENSSEFLRLGLEHNVPRRHPARFVCDKNGG